MVLAAAILTDHAFLVLIRWSSLIFAAAIRLLVSTFTLEVHMINNCEYAGTVGCVNHRANYDQDNLEEWFFKCDECPLLKEKEEEESLNGS